MNKHTATVTVTFTLKYENEDSAKSAVSNLINYGFYSVAGIYNDASIRTDVELIEVETSHPEGGTTYASYSAGTALR